MKIEIEPLQTLIDRHILEAVQKCEGDVERAATLLGVARSTVYRNLARIRNGEIRNRTEVVFSGRQKVNCGTEDSSGRSTTENRHEDVSSLETTTR